MRSAANETRPRPPWAERVLMALADAGAFGYTSTDSAEVRLTTVELELLDGIAYRLRGRLGERLPGADAMPLSELGDAVLKRAMESIAGEVTS